MAHEHYFKSVKGLDEIDVYRVCQLFNVTDQAIGHAVKKLLLPGKRGAGKDTAKDVQEAIDSLKRWQAMRSEDASAARKHCGVDPASLPAPTLCTCCADCGGKPCQTLDACPYT
jgi:hypothetical protein